MYTAECPDCHRKHKAEKINDSVLNLKHHPECPSEKGMSWKPIIRDTKYDKKKWYEFWK